MPKQKTIPELKAEIADNERQLIERLMSCASRNCEREADEAAACRQGKRSIMARLEPYRYLKL